MSKSLFEHTRLKLGCSSWYDNVDFELITDLDMYIFLGEGSRGGNSYISNIYSKANNKYLKSCNPKEEWLCDI